MSKEFVFTLIPFSDSFDDIYKFGVKQTCEDLGAYCERVDEQIFQGSILDRILNQIFKADIIIADMTGRNPNVFFEVGYAKALDKKIILLTSNVDDIPFDLKHYSHIVYSNSIDSIKLELTKQLSYYFAQPEKPAKEFLLGINLYIDGTRLEQNKETEVEVSANVRTTTLTVENVSTEVFRSGDIKLGAVNNWGAFDAHKPKYMVLPDNNEMHIVECSSSLFPESIETFMFVPPPNEGESINMLLKVYTKNGCNDFVIKMIAKSTR